MGLSIHTAMPGPNGSDITSDRFPWKGSSVPIGSMWLEYEYRHLCTIESSTVYQNRFNQGEFLLKMDRVRTHVPSCWWFRNPALCTIWDVQTIGYSGPDFWSPSTLYVSGTSDCREQTTPPAIFGWMSTDLRTSAASAEEILQLRPEVLKVFDQLTVMKKGPYELDRNWGMKWICQWLG